jgi:hypothetical protein
MGWIQRPGLKSKGELRETKEITYVDVLRVSKAPWGCHYLPVCLCDSRGLRRDGICNSDAGEGGFVPKKPRTGGEHYEILMAR